MLFYYSKPLQSSGLYWLSFQSVMHINARVTNTIKINVPFRKGELLSGRCVRRGGSRRFLLLFLHGSCAVGGERCIFNRRMMSVKATDVIKALQSRCSSESCCYVVWSRCVWYLVSSNSQDEQAAAQQPVRRRGGCGTPPPLTGDRETLGRGDQARCEERIECFGGFYRWFAKMHNKFELNQNLKRCQCLKTGKLLHNTRKWDKNPLYTTVTSEARINNI